MRLRESGHGLTMVGGGGGGGRGRRDRVPVNNRSVCMFYLLTIQCCVYRRISEFLLLKDMSQIPNYLWYEYTSVRQENRLGDCCISLDITSNCKLATLVFFSFSESE